MLKEAARAVIPAAVIDRPKGYFPVPALKYLRGAFLESVRATLDSAAARSRGLPVWGEVCVHHLFADESDLERPDFEGAKYVFTPPPRGAADRERLPLPAGLEGYAARVAADPGHLPRGPAEVAHDLALARIAATVAARRHGRPATASEAPRPLADVGLVGLPNAGKSTFINAVSNAGAKVGAYAFTTLRPQLGVVSHQGREFVVADIPGLIEGAAEGAGIGDRFLGHIERCQTLLHLVDANDEDVATS